MAFQVLVTEIANEDLAGLVRYIARDSPPAAERFGLALLDRRSSKEGTPVAWRSCMTVEARQGAGGHTPDP